LAASKQPALYDLHDILLLLPLRSLKLPSTADLACPRLASRFSHSVD
jgi:hypothetical protein